MESREFAKDLRYYQSCLEALLQYSPSAQVFCLVHKMDLIEETKRDAVSLLINIFYNECFTLSDVLIQRRGDHEVQ